jgi:hypothetical protein
MEQLQPSFADQTSQEGFMNLDFTAAAKKCMRTPYVLRRVPEASFSSLLSLTDRPRPGDVALARMEKIGRNTNLELSNGRRCSLHEGDVLAVVFGHRYATMQFEGYARLDEDRCDLLSMGGICGLVESKHAKAADPSKLRLLGFIGDAQERPLRLRQFGLAPRPCAHQSQVIVVCGTSMDAGKTHTALSLIVGLRQQGLRVAAIKLTGTATGKDTWNMLDAGACVALDFVDGGFASTYLCSGDELLDLYQLLMAHATSHKPDYVVIEIADGLLQNETAALLQNRRFTRTVDAWVFAAGDPLGAAGGVRVMRDWGIEPLAISGVVSMSALGIRETQLATELPCLTAQSLKCGELNPQLSGVKSASAISLGA